MSGGRFILWRSFGDGRHRGKVLLLHCSQLGQLLFLKSFPTWLSRIVPALWRRPYAVITAIPSALQAARSPQIERPVGEWSARIPEKDKRGEPAKAIPPGQRMRRPLNSLLQGPERLDRNWNGRGLNLASISRTVYQRWAEITIIQYYCNRALAGSSRTRVATPGSKP